jgi:hypothetical protein
MIEEGERQFRIISLAKESCDPEVTGDTQPTNLDVNFVSTQDNRDVFADTLKITMPIRDVLVRDPGCDIKHDDSALPLDVITVTQSTKLFLTGGIPDVEANSAEVGEELQWVNFHTQSG